MGESGSQSFWILWEVIPEEFCPRIIMIDDPIRWVSTIGHSHFIVTDLWVLPSIKLLCAKAGCANRFEVKGIESEAQPRFGKTLVVVPSHVGRCAFKCWLLSRKILVAVVSNPDRFWLESCSPVNGLYPVFLSKSVSENENERIASVLNEMRQVLRLSGGSHSQSCLEIDGSVELIRKDDFCCESLKTVTFSSQSLLREIDGFQHCISLLRIGIPSSVEQITEHGFRGCTSLVEVIFSSDSHSVAIDGFQDCTSLCRIALPESAEIIGPHAFAGCIRLHTVHLPLFGLRTLSGFTGTLALRSLVLPLSLETISVRAFQCERSPGYDSRRIFLHYPEVTLTRRREHLARQHPCFPSRCFPDEEIAEIVRVYDYEQITQDKMILESLINLPVLTLGDPLFAASLVLKSRIRPNFKNLAGYTKRFVPMADVQHEDVRSARCTLDSVICMFAAGPGFQCTHPKHRAPQDSFIFLVQCSQCGDDSSVRVECPSNGLQLVVSTRKCCGHFFLGRMPPRDPRGASLLVTNPEVRVDHAYQSTHPLRVIARTLLKTHSLGAGHRALLQGWIEAATPVHHGISLPSRAGSLEDVMQRLHGTFWVQRDLSVRGLLEHGGAGVITLIWLAPWAVTALKEAQFYELDCSFEALRPYTYSIPMAVRANRGIPLGIAVAPTERREIFRNFADHLIDHGFSRDCLAELPLLSDEGAAINAYAVGYHRFHFYCYRHLLEALGSGTLAAMLARRLLFTYTELEFMGLINQTVSDFHAGCSQGFITASAKTKFQLLFGLGSGSTVDVSIFRRQALWGDRGVHFGVSTCTNHIEGLHGRLNASTRSAVSLHSRFAKIVEIIRSSAGDWAKRVGKARHKALRQLAERAARHCAGDGVCNFPDCDKGIIMSRRYELVFPCVHVIRPIPDRVALMPLQFDLGETGEPSIIVKEGSGPGKRIWSVPSSRSHETGGKIAEPEVLGLTAGQHEHFVARIRQELRYMNREKDFPYSAGEMLFRLGRIHGREARTAEEITRANSAFLMECIQIIRKELTW
jgi:hypothetical protein